ncbi:putative f-box domain protein [Ilyonectria robusta]
MSSVEGSFKLSPDILYIVCSFTSRGTLFQLRLTSRALNQAATFWAFRHVRLDARTKVPRRFVELAQCQKLRPLVQEITCDTWIGPHHQYEGVYTYKIPADFMNALPYLRYFHGLKALHLRFNECCGDENRAWSIPVEETWDFRFRVLDTVFQCLAGTWSPEKQEETDKGLALGFEAVYTTPELEVDNRTMSPIRLNSLTISNLADYHDERLANSDAFKRVLSSPTLVDLKLLISTHAKEVVSSLYFPEKHDFFESLPNTWLSPPLAQNLRVLSLYFQNYWGWCPKMDFRAVNPGRGPYLGFPQLKVLALGNFTFSHEWQIGWIASLGQNNGSGGLEELYLDDCPILYKAHQLSPMDESETMLGHDEDGNMISVSNHGYPIKEVVAHRAAGGPSKLRLRGLPTQTQEHAIRWFHVFRQWQERMKGLRVFRMGHGVWHTTPADTFNACRSDESFAHVNNRILARRVQDHGFRSFDCPAPMTPQPEFDDWLWNERLVDSSNPKYLNGTGLCQDRVDVMQYIRNDCNWWIPRGWANSYGNRKKVVWAPEESTIDQDDAAFEMFLSVVQSRHNTVDG